MTLAVVALGGNALIQAKEKGTAEHQVTRLNETITRLKPLAEAFTLVLTHGNGPQVGNLLLQQECSKDTVPGMPLDVLDAMTQGQLGYWVQQSVENIWGRNAVTIVTRVQVAADDPAFLAPTKPIGPYYAEKTYPHMVKTPAGWRRIVPSPKPVSIVDIEEIETLVRNGFIVIACGGGGIPVICRDGKFEGVEAVVDKDYSSARLAGRLKAEYLFFLTDVPHVYRNFRRPGEEPLKRLTVKEGRAMTLAGEFGEGSMRPKVEAGLDFLESGGKRVIITSVDEIQNALAGNAGTTIE